MITGEYAVAWVCTDCLMTLANGECEAPDREPLSRVADGEHWTLGMVDDEHGCGQPWDREGGRECDCEVRTYSRWPCEGCGSPLGGDRHAATVWTEEA